MGKRRKTSCKKAKRTRRDTDNSTSSEESPNDVNESSISDFESLIERASNDSGVGHGNKFTRKLTKASRDIIKITTVERGILKRRMAINQMEKEITQLDRALAHQQKVYESGNKEMDLILKEDKEKNDPDNPKALATTSMEAATEERQILDTIRSEDPKLKIMYDEIQLLPNSYIYREKLYQHIHGIDLSEHRAEQRKRVSVRRVVEMIVRGFIDYFLVKIYSGGIENSEHSLFLESEGKALEFLGSDYQFGPIREQGDQERIRNHCIRLGQTLDRNVMNELFDLTNYIEKVMIRAAVIQAIAIDMEVDFDLAEEIFDFPNEDEEEDLD